jgi:hypothetical protein
MKYLCAGIVAIVCGCTFFDAFAQERAFVPALRWTAAHEGNAAFARSVALVNASFGEDGSIVVAAHATDGGYVTSGTVPLNGDVSEVAVYPTSRGEVRLWVSVDGGGHYREVMPGVTYTDMESVGASLRWKAYLAPGAALHEVVIAYRDASGVRSDFGDPRLSGFSECAKVTLESSETDELFDRQIFLTLGEKESRGAQVVVSTMRADMGDVRFATADGRRALAYVREWVRGERGSRVAGYWVRVPRFSGGKATVTVYAGSAEAQDASDPSAVFDAYIPCDDEKALSAWTIENAVRAQVLDGSLVLEGGRAVSTAHIDLSGRVLEVVSASLRNISLTLLPETGSDDVTVRGDADGVRLTASRGGKAVAETAVVPAGATSLFVYAHEGDVTFGSGAVSAGCDAKIARVRLALQSELGRPMTVSVIRVRKPLPEGLRVTTDEVALPRVAEFVGFGVDESGSLRCTHGSCRYVSEPTTLNHLPRTLCADANATGEVTLGVLSEKGEMLLSAGEVRLVSDGLFEPFAAAALTVSSDHAVTVERATFSFESEDIVVKDTAFSVESEKDGIRQMSAVSQGGRWSDASTWRGNITPGTDTRVTVQESVVVAEGTFAFGRLEIGSPDGSREAIFIVRGQPDPKSGDVIVNPGATVIFETRALFRIAGTFVVKSGARVSADGAGFAGGLPLQSGGGIAPGVFQSNGCGSGGTYGGVGGVTDPDLPAPAVYGGEQTALRYPGSSGGGSRLASGGSGGGVIAIDAATVILDGEMSANGHGGGIDPKGVFDAGGGSGGTVYVAARTHGELRGSISADGGSGHVSGGGGGGGRVVLKGLMTKGAKFSAKGGSGRVSGASGSIRSEQVAA